MYKRSQNAIFSEVGDDVVALHIQRGQCYGMEKVAADVWNLLAEPSDLESICSDLIERYDVERNLCRTDVANLLEQMQSQGLIEKVPSAA